jgi:hypothetical protein
MRLFTRKTRREKAALEHAALVPLVPSPETRAYQHAEGLVLLHLANGVIFTSNRTGAAIWKELQDRQTLPVIARRLAVDYGISEQVAATDAVSFCTQLKQQGFLVGEAEC